MRTPRCQGAGAGGLGTGVGACGLVGPAREEQEQEKKWDYEL